jgi:hypothetical protein
MKIEREILYSIVMKDGAKIEVSEQELKQLFEQLKHLFGESKKLLEPKIAAPKYSL